MKYEIVIKRGTTDHDGGYEHFVIDTTEESSVLWVLEQLNLRDPLKTKDGTQTEKIGWECGCKQSMCGACAMIINGRPMLACKAFLKDLKSPITLEPFRKFPLIRDLIVDKSCLNQYMMDMKVWLSEETESNTPSLDNKTSELLYRSAACIQCGCCLEACPNYSGIDHFYGAMMANAELQVTNLETNRKEVKKDFKEVGKHFDIGCSNSFACEEVCPAHIPLSYHISQLNSLAWKTFWGKRK